MEDSKDPVIKKIKVNLDTRINTIREASLNTTKASSEIISVEEKLSRMQLKEVCANLINSFAFEKYLQRNYFISFNVILIYIAN